MEERAEKFSIAAGWLAGCGIEKNQNHTRGKIQRRRHHTASTKPLLHQQQQQQQILCIEMVRDKRAETRGAQRGEYPGICNSRRSEEARSSIS